MPIHTAAPAPHPHPACNENDTLTLSPHSTCAVAAARPGLALLTAYAAAVAAIVVVISSSGREGGSSESACVCGRGAGLKFVWQPEPFQSPGTGLGSKETVTPKSSLTWRRTRYPHQRRHPTIAQLRPNDPSVSRWARRSIKS